MHRLRTFGLVDLRSSKGRELLPATGDTTPLALLVYLAVARPAGPHDREKLAALFWGQLDTRSAFQALDDTLDVLATALGDGAITGRDTASVGLDGDCCACDAAQFRTLLDAGRTADALALYRGDFLQGFKTDGTEFHRWMKAERAVLRRQGAHGARALADQYESRGRLTTAVTWAKRGLEMQFDDERALRRLLRLLDRAGDRKTALRIYERFSRRMHDDLARDPASPTTELVARIRRAASVPNQEPGSARVPPGMPLDVPRPPREHRIQ